MTLSESHSSPAQSCSVTTLPAGRAWNRQQTALPLAQKRQWPACVLSPSGGPHRAPDPVNARPALGGGVSNSWSRCTDPETPPQGGAQGWWAQSRPHSRGQVCEQGAHAGAGESRQEMPPHPPVSGGPTGEPRELAKPSETIQHGRFQTRSSHGALVAAEPPPAKSPSKT